MASARNASRGTFSIAANTRRSAMPRPAIWRRTMRRRGSVTVAMTAKRPTPTRVARTCDLFRTARVLLPHLGVAGAALGLRCLQLGGFLGIERASCLACGLVDLALLHELGSGLVVGLGAAVAALAFDVAVLLRLVVHDNAPFTCSAEGTCAAEQGYGRKSPVSLKYRATPGWRRSAGAAATVFFAMVSTRCWGAPPCRSSSCSALTRRYATASSSSGRASTKLHEPTDGMASFWPGKLPAACVTSFKNGCWARMRLISLASGATKRAPLS